MNNIVESLFKKKNRFWIVCVIILISMILINICMEMMAFNYSNMQNGILNNDRLKLLQVFAQNEKNGDMYLDLADLKKVEHVVFAEETYPIAVNILDENGDIFGSDQLFVEKLPRNAGEYVGIVGELENDTIYCPVGSISAEASKNIRIDKEFENIGIKVVIYDGCPPQMIEEDSFANEETYDKIMKADRKRIGEEYADLLYSTPSYLVGIDDTVNVFNTVDVLKESFDGYDIRVAYQASGLKALVKNSSNMVSFEILVAILVLIVSLFTIYAYISIFIGKQEKNMMILYINGMTRESIVNQLYKIMQKVVTLPELMVSVISLIGYVVLGAFVFKTLFSIYLFIGIFIVNIIIVVLNNFFLHYVIRKKINRRTANSNITSIIRN